MLVARPRHAAFVRFIMSAILPNPQLRTIRPRRLHKVPDRPQRDPSEEALRLTDEARYNLCLGEGAT